MSAAGSTTSTTPIDPAILREAADWLTRLHEGQAGPAEWEAIEHWRATSPEHGNAWLRAEALMGDLRSLPNGRNGPLRTALERRSTARRNLLRLAWLPLVPTIGWLAWQQGRVEGTRWRSTTGEQRTLKLADGTRLLLNTGTDIAVQVDPQARRIHLLAGEILVTSAASKTARPLQVLTADGTVHPIGTRFAVRRTEDDASTRVTVFEGAVEVAAHGERRSVNAGQRLDFSQDGVGITENGVTSIDEAWTRGLIVARRMRLADLVAELGRYHPGLLRCHPEVSELRISGTFPALAIERSLQLLAATLPVRVRYRSSYWITIERHPQASASHGPDSRTSP